MLADTLSHSQKVSIQDRYRVAENLATEEIRATFPTGSSTRRYRIHGYETLTCGDQFQWLRSIIVNEAIAIPQEWIPQKGEKDINWAYHRILDVAMLNQFTAFPEIEYIFSKNGERGNSYYIFLNNDHYDRELMYKFFDIELELSNIVPGRFDTFHYLPLAMGADPSKDIPETAVKLFTRG